MSAFDSQPNAFLEVRVHRLEEESGISGLCVGYEQKEWRTKALARHLIKWLPEFALTSKEIEGLGHANAVELVAAAAKSLYTTAKFENRGEFGELLLHIALRQCFKTLPAISKYFYKDANNDTVKGFDAVHVVASDSSLELWLGESKFYSEIGRAIGDVLVELEQHLERNYLRAEFAAITNKIDDSWVHAARLKKLLHPDTSLDEVFDCVCIPVLLTYESDTVRAFDQISESYKEQFVLEIEKNYTSFKTRALNKGLPLGIRIHLFLVPLHEKMALVSELDVALKAAQALQ